jgi:hypothetical protein
MARDQPSKRARRTSSSTSGAGESGHRRSSGQGRCRLSRCGSGHRRVRIPAVRLGFVVGAVHGLLARHAEGGEPTPVLGLRPNLPAPVTDPLDPANGMRQSMRYHGVLLDEAAWRHGPWIRQAVPPPVAVAQGTGWPLA